MSATLTRRSALALAATAIVAIPWPAPASPTHRRRRVPLLLQGGRFRVRLRDDSCLPRFPKGTILELENCHPTGIRDGAFVLARIGDLTTLRQARRPDADGALLRATNPGRRYGRRRVEWREVDRLAVVVGVFVPLDEARPA